jgi:hypothetical protein
MAVSRLHDVYNGIVVRCRNGELRMALAPDSTVDLHARGGEKLESIGGGDRTSIYAALKAEWKDFLARCATPESLADTGLLTTAFLDSCGRAARPDGTSAASPQRSPQQKARHDREHTS